MSRNATAVLLSALSLWYICSDICFGQASVVALEVLHSSSNLTPTASPNRALRPFPRVQVSSELRISVSTRFEHTDAQMDPSVQNLVCQLILHLHRSDPDPSHTIMVFLPTYNSLELQSQALQSTGRGLKVYALHSSIDIDQCIRAMEASLQDRKVGGTETGRSPDRRSCDHGVDSDLAGWSMGVGAGAGIEGFWGLLRISGQGKAAEGHASLLMLLTTKPCDNDRETSATWLIRSQSL
jgi:hypothetical protein